MWSVDPDLQCRRMTAKRNIIKAGLLHKTGWKMCLSSLPSMLPHFLLNRDLVYKHCHWFLLNLGFQKLPEWLGAEVCFHIPSLSHQVTLWSLWTFGASETPPDMSEHGFLPSSCNYFFQIVMAYIVHFAANLHKIHFTFHINTGNI